MEKFSVDYRNIINISSGVTLVYYGRNTHSRIPALLYYRLAFRAIPRKRLEGGFIWFWTCTSYWNYMAICFSSHAAMVFIIASRTLH